jgi:hypothetical protein
MSSHAKHTAHNPWIDLATGFCTLPNQGALGVQKAWKPLPKKERDRDQFRNSMTYKSNGWNAESSRLGHIDHAMNCAEQHTMSEAEMSPNAVPLILM